MPATPFLENFALLFGRVFFSLLFIITGLGKITSFNDSLAFITSIGLPAPTLLLTLAIVFELGGSLMILLGWKTRLGAAMLAIFVIAATIIIHAFWRYPDQEVQNQIFHFMKNITIFGGTLYIMATGAGAYSLDARAVAAKTQIPVKA